MRSRAQPSAIMAGSRTEKIGTIFSRVQGMLKTGAIKDVDKPIWYEVYERFPPLHEPKYERLYQERGVQPILYKEDVIRARFYKTFGSPDAIDMKDACKSSICQRFITLYEEMEKTEMENKSGIFDAVVEQFKTRGIELRTLESIAQEKKLKMLLAKKEAEDKKKSESAADNFTPTVGDIFGKDLDKPMGDEPDSFPEEEYKPPR